MATATIQAPTAGDIEERPAETRPLMRLIFKHANRYVVVPLFRLGLGWATGSPPGGYIMVLKTTGCKSGKPRYAPVNYAILNGNVYCLAGWGRKSHWFANLAANPRVELIMPGGALAGLAEEVTDLDEARRAILQVARNAGFATLFDGLNPLTATDEQIIAKVGDVPVVRICPVGLGNGPYDPNGWGWLLPAVAQVAALIWLAARLTRRKSRQGAALSSSNC